MSPKKLREDEWRSRGVYVNAVTSHFASVEWWRIEIARSKVSFEREIMVLEKILGKEKKVYIP